MKAAVVILNWNGKAHLEKYLPFITAFTDLSEHDVYVADNGSDDESVSFVKENFKEIGVIQLDNNYGFAGGYNRALSKIEADIYVILNSDVRVTKYWLDPIIDIFKSNDDVAAIQPKILSDRDWSRFEHAGAAGGFIDKYGYPFCRGRIMNAIEYDRGQYNRQSDIFWASGACLFIRAGIFHQLGGFDDDYFAHMEEIDLCWRLNNRGYRVVYTSKSKVYHWGGATLEYDNPQKLFLNFRNSLWTLYKNYRGSNFGWILFKRKLIDGIAAIKFLIVFDFKNFSAVYRAHRAFSMSKGAIRKKRKEECSHTIRKKNENILNRSIVVSFFLRGKKIFNDLKEFKTSLNYNSLK